MCKLCASALIFLVSLALSQAFFLPIFVRKQPQTPAPNAVNNVAWNNHPPASAYKDFGGYSAPVTQLHPVPMASVPQYSYETPALAAMASYQVSNVRMQPQFHNVQLVPCMCPLTRDVIEQQYHNMVSSSGNSVQTGTNDPTKTGSVQNSHKTS